MRFYVHRGSVQARVHPRRWLSLSSRAKAFTLKGRHRRFVGDSAFHTSLRGAPLLVGEQQKWYQQILQKVQNLVPHNYIKSCTVYTVVQQYVLVDYCSFRLTSDASTAVGPYIIPRNRKRFFLSQSTLREEFVEKKYQVLCLCFLLTRTCNRRSHLWDYVDLGRHSVTFLEFHRMVV